MLGLENRPPGKVDYDDRLYPVTFAHRHPFPVTLTTPCSVLKMHARSRTLFSLLSLSTQLSRTSHECNKNNPKKTRVTTLLIPSILLSAIIFAYVPLQQDKTACLRLTGKLSFNLCNCSIPSSFIIRVTLQLFTPFFFININMEYQLVLIMNNLYGKLIFLRKSSLPIIFFLFIKFTLKNLLKKLIC